MTEGQPSNFGIAQENMHATDDRTAVRARVRLRVGSTWSRRALAFGAPAQPPGEPEWRVWVSGARAGSDISRFVHKVVFRLHRAYVYPKRVIYEPPYEIQESGEACFDMPIDIYIKHSRDPKKLTLTRSLNIRNDSLPSDQCDEVFYDFENPNEDLKRCLLLGGCEIIPIKQTKLSPKITVEKVMTDKHKTEDKPIVMNVDDKIRKTKDLNDNEVKRKIKNQTKHDVKKLKSTDANGKHNICSNTEKQFDLKTILKNVVHPCLTQPEIDLVTKLYASIQTHEKSANALVLPVVSDPIFRIPDLPKSLVGFNFNVDQDYALK